MADHNFLGPEFNGNGDVQKTEFKWELHKGRIYLYGVQSFEHHCVLFIYVRSGPMGLNLLLCC